MRETASRARYPETTPMTHPLSRPDRRAFLRSGAAASLALAAPALARDDKKAPEFGGFTVGIQSYTFRQFKLEPALQRIQELGLKYVEFYNGHVPVTTNKAQIAAVKKLCGEYGITPVAFGVEGFGKNHDANKVKFEFAQELGIKSLSADPTPDSFDSLDKLVEETKVAIAIHPHGPSGNGGRHRWWSAEVILKAVKDHHPLIGTCLDTGHLIRMEQLGEKLDPAQQVRVMGARNFGMHLKDHDNQRKEDVVFGKGVLDVGGVLKALKEVDFKGAISIEYEAHAENPSPDLKECVTYLAGAAKAVS
jgi:sugar phosphate isomerase/epimerase